MKGSTLILVLVTLGLIVAQTHVEAKSCCPTTTARNVYNICRLAKTPRTICAMTSGCKVVDQKKCPAKYPKLVFELDVPEEEEGLKGSSSTWNVISTSAPSDIIRYCKLGCTSSMCFPITTPQNSADGEDEEIVRCNKACSYICTKGSDAGLTA
ncbi:hypothetical protein ACHQM5_025323 [Ranunculus cassubicifolius]